MEPRSTDASTWISIADAAVLLKVKPRTVIQRIEKGTLPSRTPPAMPFTCDGSPNYEVPLNAMPQRLQYQFLYSHLPESDICSVDLVAPRTVLAMYGLTNFLTLPL